MTEGVIWAGNETLRPLLREVASLRDDPANLNLHDERSYGAVTGSYARFRQQKPVVIDGDGVVRAGNAQLEAAGLGWTHLAAVESDLAGDELTGFAIADNQTPKAAELDHDRLVATLSSLQEAGVAVDDLGWDDGEIQGLIGGQWAPAAVGPMPGPVARDGANGSGLLPVLLDVGQRNELDVAVAAVREMEDAADLTEGEAIERMARWYLDERGL